MLHSAVLSAKNDYCVISVLVLFIVIAASRSANTNVVSAGVVMRAKPGTEPDVHKLLANYKTGFGYRFCSG